MRVCIHIYRCVYAYGYGYTPVNQNKSYMHAYLYTCIRLHVYMHTLCIAFSSLLYMITKKIVQVLQYTDIHAHIEYQKKTDTTALHLYFFSCAHKTMDIPQKHDDKEHVIYATRICTSAPGLWACGLTVLDTVRGAPVEPRKGHTGHGPIPTPRLSV